MNPEPVPAPSAPCTLIETTLGSTRWATPATEPEGRLVLPGDAVGSATDRSRPEDESPRPAHQAPAAPPSSAATRATSTAPVTSRPVGKRVPRFPAGRTGFSARAASAGA